MIKAFDYHRTIESVLERFTGEVLPAVDALRDHIAPDTPPE